MGDTMRSQRRGLLRYLPVVLPWLGLLSGGCIAAPLASAAPSWRPQVQQWGMEEVVLRSTHAYANPFTDVTLQATFRCGNRTLRVEGFADGDGIWKVRFMPQRQGSCTFTTHSNDASLNAVSGGFMVTPPKPGNHGPVRVCKAYYFCYADGTPFFPLGTTSYNWLNRDAKLQDETLATLRKTRFNKLRFLLFPKWYAFNRVDPPEFPYVRKADGTFDLNRFNPAFFANVDRRIRELEAMGVQADIILFHPYDHWGFSTMDPAHNEAWIRYVAARLSAYRNVWWTMANEYDLMTPRNWNRLGRVLRASDPYGHPAGIHNAGPWFDPRQPWIDHVIIQDGTGFAGRSAYIARRRYGKPVIVDEFGYEGNNAQAWGELSGRQEVDRAWGITMAGAYFSHGETYVHPGGVIWWAAGGKLVGESPPRLAFLKTVMTSLPFQEMVPSPGLVVNGSALAQPGHAYLFWFPWKQGQFFMPRSQIRLAGGPLFKVELIDPWLMRTYLLGYTSSGDQAFTMPVAPALLRITAAAKGAGEPRPVGDLLGVFAGDFPTTAKADPALFNAGPMHYGLDFQIWMLQQNPAADALLEKYLPKRVLHGRATVFPLSALLKFTHTRQQTVRALAAALGRIPVQ